MKRSKLVIAVGIYLILGGFVYLSPPPPYPDGSPGQITQLTFLASAILFALGLGLILHKRLALHAFWVLAVILPTSVLGLGIVRGDGLSFVLTQVLVVAVLLAIPSFLLWTRRGHFKPNIEIDPNA